MKGYQIMQHQWLGDSSAIWGGGRHLVLNKVEVVHGLETRRHLLAFTCRSFYTLPLRSQLITIFPASQQSRKMKQQMKRILYWRTQRMVEMGWDMMMMRLKMAGKSKSDLFHSLPRPLATMSTPEAMYKRIFP